MEDTTTGQGTTVETPKPSSLQTFQGNKYDLYALIAGTLGGSTLLMCFSANFGLYCLPLLPLVLGIITLRNAKMAHDPERTKNLAWVGIAGGGIATVLVVCAIGFLIIYLIGFFAFFGTFMRSVPQR